MVKPGLLLLSLAALAPPGISLKAKVKQSMELKEWMPHDIFDGHPEEEMRNGKRHIQSGRGELHNGITMLRTSNAELKSITKQEADKISHLRNANMSLDAKTVDSLLNLAGQLVQEQGKLEDQMDAGISTVDAGSNKLSLGLLETNDATKPKPRNSSSESETVLTVPLVTGCGRGGTHSVAKWLNENNIPAVHEGIAPGAMAVSWLYAPFANDEAHTLNEVRVPFDHINQSSWSNFFTNWKPEFAKYADDSKVLAQQHPEFVRQDTNSSVKLVFHPIVHVVREPLKAIASLERCFCGSGHRTHYDGSFFADKKSYEFAEKYVGSLGETHLERAAKYWLKWHSLAGQHASHTFRLEDPKGALDMVKVLGINNEGFSEMVHSTKGKSSDSAISKETLTWDELGKKIGSDLAKEIKEKGEEYGYVYQQAH